MSPSDRSVLQLGARVLLPSLPGADAASLLPAPGLLRLPGAVQLASLVEKLTPTKIRK